MSETYYQFGPLLPPDEDDEVFDVVEEQVTKIERQQLKHLIPFRANRFGQTDATLAKTQKAHDAFHQAYYLEAIELYKEAIEGNPQVSEAWLGLSASYYFSEDYSLADAALTGYIDSHPLHMRVIEPISLLIASHINEMR